MTLWRRFRTTWRNLSRPQQADCDPESELRSYRELLEDEKARSGLTPAQARREAQLELGSTSLIHEQVRDVRLGVMLANIAAEIRQSLRSLRRNPGLTIMGTLMLAVGMGASTIVFSIFHAALIRPLPFRDPARLVEFFETRLPRGINQASFSEANFWDLRSLNHSFEEMAAYHGGEANLTGNGAPEKITASRVTAGFFRTLGVAPLLGRDFAYDEGREGGPGVLILGNKFWKGRFSGDPAILGRTLRLNDKAYTVIGVLPPGRPWIDDQSYIPFEYRADADRSSWEFNVVGRLKPGITAGAARTDLERVAAILAAEYPKEDHGMGFGTLGVFGAIALLLAVTGIYGVLAYTMSRRTSEIGLRLALGASASSIRRMTLAQGMRPVVAGLVAGAVAAWWLSKSFTVLLFGVKPFDGITYAAVAAVLLLPALLACYLPARMAMRVDPAITLRID